MSAEPIAGESPSPDETFLIEWGRDTVRENLNRCFEAQKAILTLSTSLLGGTAAFLSEAVLPRPHRAVVLVALFVAMCLSLLGAIPVESSVDLRVPADIAAHKKRAFTIKRRLLAGSGCAMALALGYLVGYIVTSVLPCTRGV